MASTDEWICVGDINHPLRVFPHGSTFPTEEVQAWATRQGRLAAKKAGLNIEDGSPDAEDVARYVAQFEATWAAGFQELIDCGSLKHPGDVLPAPVLADQLAAKDAEIEALRAQLAAQGLPPSLASKGKAEATATK